MADRQHMLPNRIHQLQILPMTTTPSDAGDAIPGLWIVRGHNAAAAAMSTNTVTADDARRGAQMAIMCLQMLVFCFGYRHHQLPAGVNVIHTSRIKDHPIVI
jgi:hypothetical protein